MRRLIFWAMFLVILYSGYWFAATRGIDRALTDGVATARQDGWHIDYDGLDMAGYPGAFDLQIADVQVVANDGQWAWVGPDVRLSAPSIKPTQLSLFLPETQTVRFGDQTLQIDSATFLVKAATGLNTALRFDAASVVMVAATAVSDFNWEIGVDSLLGRFAAVPDTYATYTLNFDATDLMLPSLFVRQIDPDRRLSDTIATMALQGEVTLDTVLDRFAFDGSKAEPQVERIIITGSDLTWDGIQVETTAALDINPDGVLDGQITFKTAQPGAIIDLMVAAGALDPGIAPTLGNMAAAMADDGGLLELPITFRDGAMSMGFLPLGPAPRLH